MFTSVVKMHLSSVGMKIERNKKDEAEPVVQVGLTLEPLTPDLAEELSAEIAEHCFDKKGRPRAEIQAITFDLDEKQQRIVAKSAEDGVEPNATLKNARPVSVTITVRGEKPDPGVKQKKVAPQNATIRATVLFLVQPNDAETRQFLMCRFKSTHYFEFGTEQKQIDFGPAPKPKKDDPQKGLDFDGAKAKKAAKDAEISDDTINERLSEVGLGMLPKYLKHLTPAHRKEIVAYVDKYQKAREKNSKVLPTAPMFVMDPEQLLPAAATTTADAPSAPKADLDDKPAKKKVVRGKFTNHPRKKK